MTHSLAQRLAAASMITLGILLFARIAVAAPNDGSATPPWTPNDQPGVRAPAPTDPTWPDDALKNGSGSSLEGSLSDRLSRSGGVIKPPAEGDRAIQAPTPDPGAQSMPVIPPPGTPGGNLDVKPK
jgi:hypothetical protein